MKWIYKALYSFAKKLCNKYSYLGWLRDNVRKFLLYINTKVAYFKNFHYNRQVIKELKTMIALAKKNNQPIFIQFPVIPWHIHLFQRPQQLAKAMAELDYLTIYLFPSVPKYSLQQISDNLYLSNACEILADVEGAVVSVYINYPDYYNLDDYLSEQFFKNNKVVCEYVDHIDEQIFGKGFAEVIRERFEKIPELGFSLLLGTSRILYDELITKFPQKQILYSPNGVDPSHFTMNNKRKGSFTVPKKVEEAFKQNRKIIGFFGALAPWIWDELIIELSEKRPEFFILMIGPGYGQRQSFQQRRNIYLTGAVNYHDLPFYANHFDVSIIPFRLGDVAKSTSPVKLFEYFSIGKPIVVTSDLVECTRFDGVYSASTIQEFIEQVDHALELKDNTELQKKYKKYANENSWITRAKSLVSILNQLSDKEISVEKGL